MRTKVRRAVLSSGLLGGQKGADLVPVEGAGTEDGVRDNLDLVGEDGHEPPTPPDRC